MGNRVHPTAIVGEGVELGTDNVIGPYAVITGPCRIGDRNWIGAHAVIGAAPEIHGHDHGLPWGGGTDDVGVEIGDDSVVREFVTVHRGTRRRTGIGDRCFVMNKAHFGHDAVIEDDVTLAVGVILGGHVEVGAGANLGLAAVLHQRRVVGPGAMVGMSAVVTRDIPPYAKAFGAPARVRGVNEVGMRRRGIDAAVIAAVAEQYASGGDAGAWTPPAALRAPWEWWLERTSAG
ncbi:UDP-N-acetylglucosamine acyltransferase [Blastococcus goldschmidtiae]|uniref:UDP-N-acetylglucosamine acyltransferase n=1 Tax=Blastococcus goldschmidtiae TaxID=3075546 RepID=A0ABU2KE11_9ACTN|nr:UDP-N-acetylglucosamine acyltransferase [Blastococcus sp. DSM 46792]MDT0278397.1 UDP-N-acetylglucosamine acyltransferase [Blastococcus sp. DSM 46792]